MSADIHLPEIGTRVLCLPKKAEWTRSVWLLLSGRVGTVMEVMRSRHNGKEKVPNVKILVGFGADEKGEPRKVAEAIHWWLEPGEWKCEESSR